MDVKRVEIGAAVAEKFKTRQPTRGQYTHICYSQNKKTEERKKQNRSTEGCSKLKSPETRQVHERLVSTLEHMQVPKWDRTRCPEE